ncbi:hypothetical protein EHW64_14265 [Erwinia psidii]|uniref:hypothetical protein n=1 Tax=Erwinia psidii TaxID=69224 RepID=UPI00226B47D9|nr:hypothetical protein [Erwinia psidii]MCX8962263.1 hypothetical protein [Erwinia psidii]
MSQSIIHSDNKITDLKLFAIIFGVMFAYLHPAGFNGSTLQTLEQWMNMTNHMFQGTNDFLFSYGPLFWMTGGTVAQYSEFSYWISLVFMSLVASLFWFYLMRLCGYFSAWFPFVVVVFLYLYQIIIPTNFFMLTPLLLVAWYECVRKNVLNSRTVVLLAVVTGMLFYIRFVYGMTAMLSIGAYLFSKSVIDKKIKATCLFVLFSLLAYFVFGLSIFHHFHNIKDYAIVNSQLSFGNAVDMTFDNVLGGNVWLAIFVIFAVTNLFLIINYPAMVLTFNILLLVLVKLGFGRADHYPGYFVLPVSVMVMVTCFHHQKWWRGVFAITICSLIYISSVPIVAGFLPPVPFYTHENFLVSPEDRAAEKYHDYLLPNDVTQLIGAKSVDVYPYNNEFLLANKLNYRHRPLFQNFMTLTPRLDKMNQAFFESEDKPDFVLWHASTFCQGQTCNSFEGFDRKYALNEDPLTSTAVMLNYHVVKHFYVNNKPVMLLQRNTDTRFFQPPVEDNHRATFGQWITIPYSADSLVKIFPVFKLTAFARFKNTFYRGDALYVHYLMANGEEKQYRLNILNSVSGVVASPHLYSFPFHGERVRKIKFTVSSDNYFAKDFSYAWDNIPLKGINIEPSVGERLSHIEYEGEATKNLCTGVIDSAKVSTENGEPEVSIQGWLALTATGLSSPDRVFIRGTDARGEEYFITTQTVTRGDVADSFKNNALQNSGYKSWFSLPATTGDNVLSLVALKEKKLYRCDNINYHYH